jgi:AraC-like DNA-binding protein
MRIYIKNMVCNRCILVVKQELNKLNLTHSSIHLGEVELVQEPTKQQKITLSQNLEELGFELIDDKKSRTISQIKSLIIDLVHHRNCKLPTNLSDFLSTQLLQDYTQLSHLFSEVEGTTIEKYYIAQKVEKVKELLVYDQLSLSEIALQLNYSSLAHLSNQFKKVTGLSPSHFKNISLHKRKPLDEV